MIIKYEIARSSDMTNYRSCKTCWIPNTNTIFTIPKYPAFIKPRSRSRSDDMKLDVCKLNSNLPKGLLSKNKLDSHLCQAQ